MSIDPSVSIPVRNPRFPIFAVLALVLIAPLAASAQTKRKLFVPGRPAVVFDERLSALRTQPDIKAPLQQRLRRGRRVGVLDVARNKSGVRFLRVAVSRNTQGWVLADAVIR